MSKEEKPNEEEKSEIPQDTIPQIPLKYKKMWSYRRFALYCIFAGIAFLCHLFVFVILNLLVVLPMEFWLVMIMNTYVAFLAGAIAVLAVLEFQKQRQLRWIQRRVRTPPATVDELIERLQKRKEMIDDVPEASGE